jgi:pyridoxal phosphate enzyme (YggS family)
LLFGATVSEAARRELVERFARARERIERAGGDPDRITIVAVTKGFGPEVVAQAQRAGHVDFGENYASELLSKAADAREHESRWHYLGAVQRTTARKLAAAVDLWQAVDGLEAGERIVRAAPGARVLVQINASGEPQKQGCTFEAAPELTARLRALSLDVRGLMAVGPAGPPEGARTGFRRVSELADRLELPERSMGMSGDLEVAVSEGATMVRLGTALFGPRPPRP